MSWIWLTCLAPAFVAGVAAMLLTVWRVPVEALQLKRSSLVFLWFMVALLAGTLDLLALLSHRIFSGEPEPTSTTLIVVGTVACQLALLVWWFRLNHFRDLARIQELGEQMRALDSEAERRKESRAILALLDQRCGKWPRPPAKLRTNLELFAALQLIRSNLWSEAEELLKAVSGQAMGAAYRSAHASGMMACRLYQGDRVGAMAWFNQTVRPAREPAIEAIHRSTDALFAVLEGKHQQALTIVGDEPEPLSEPTDLERAREHVRAHALAALGDGERSRAILRRMLERHGTGAIERVIRVDGPASPLAQAILDKRDQPYR